jgi:hypothetical protein
MTDESKDQVDRHFPKLGAGGGDRTAAVVRSVISNIPFLGQPLSEIVTELIPNQRIERVEKYLLLLGKELEALKVSPDVAKAPQNIDLIEDGAYQAVRSLSDDRKQYLARAVAVGIVEDEAEKIKAKRILALISELDDGDLLLLDSFNTDSQPESYRKRYMRYQKLAPERPVIGSPANVVERWSIHEASLARLERLSLLNNQIHVNMETKLPRFDQFSGKPEGYLSITALGRLVLSRIGLS